MTQSVAHVDSHIQVRSRESSLHSRLCHPTALCTPRRTRAYSLGTFLPGCHARDAFDLRDPTPTILIFDAHHQHNTLTPSNDPTHSVRHCAGKNARYARARSLPAAHTFGDVLKRRIFIKLSLPPSFLPLYPDHNSLNLKLHPQHSPLR